MDEAQRRAMTTPTGRPPPLPMAFGEPRPVSPSEFLVPVGPMGQALTREGEPRAIQTSELMTVAVPSLDSPLATPESGAITYPWYQLIVSLWRLAQPTGVIPGIYAGLNINSFGQVVDAQASGASIDSPNLTGNPTAPTPPLADNDTSIATTAFVKGQGFLTNITIQGDAFGSGGTVINITVDGLQTRPVSGAAPAPGQFLGWNGSIWLPASLPPAGIPEAPIDGQRYVRQNGAWVVIVSP